MSSQPPPPPAQPPPPPPDQPQHAGTPGTRPPALTTAAVLLFIVSGLRIIFGLITLVAVLGAQDEIESQLGVSSGTVVGVVTVAVLITLAVATLQLMSGVSALRQRRRAFGLGLAGCIIGIVIGIYGLASGGSGGSGALFAVLFLAVDITALVLLVQNRSHLVNE